jgi:hypothetical protein
MYFPPTNNPSSSGNQSPLTPLHDQTTFAGQTLPAHSPLPPGPTQPLASPTMLTKPYSNLVFLILAFTCLLSFVLIGVAGFGASLLLGVLTSTLIMDWRGFTTLQGWIQWKRLSGTMRTLLFCAYLFCFEFMLVIYFIRTALRFFGSPQQGVTGPGYQSPKTRKVAIGFIAGACIAGFGLCATVAAQSSTSAPSIAQHTVTATAAPTHQPTPSHKQPTAAPTPKPRLTPTPQPPTPAPTQPPAPTQAPVSTGVNGNPWGYDFNPGNLIYAPPSTFCAYFSCVSTFWKDTNGYVVECANGEYSHSGGVSGACSRDGGIAATLYSH